MNDFGRYAAVPKFQHAIAAERERLGDGPFLIVTQIAELDRDGCWDKLKLVASFAELSVARASALHIFDRICAEGPTGAEWKSQPIRSLPSPLVTDTNVKLVEQHGRRLSIDAFYADTRVVQLLEIHPAPVVGEALFRAFDWSHDLVTYFLGTG